MILQLPAVVAAEDNSPFALIQGLPVHPLVVHAAVVFVPLAALGLLAMAVLPKWGARFGWVVTLVAAMALGASFVAKESGEALEGLVGEPGYDHAEWGDRMPLIAGALFVVCLLLWLVQRSWAKREDAGKGLIVILGIVAAAVAAGSMFWIYKVGDSGAKSVWKDEVSADVSPAPTPEATTNAGASPSASKSTTATYTAAQVAKHNTSGDCWTSINGMVYDVTNWEDQHPGGAARIMSLCGIDGSSAFDNQHSGQPKPETILAGYEIGVLG